MRENDNYILNYAALLACIISECTADKAIKSITKQELKVPKHIKRVENAKKMGTNRKVKTKVINVITGEELIFDSAHEACKHLGIFKTTVSNYMKQNRIYKGEYRFEKADK